MKFTVAPSLRIREWLPAPPVCRVRRNRLPLPPAAEYFCRMMRRAVLHLDTQSR